MAKFTVEVELDWLDEGNVDEEIKNEVIEGLQRSITRNVEKEIQEKMAERINEEVEKVVSAFLEKVTLDSLEKMTFPYKEDRWSSEVKYIPISKYIGNRYEKTLREKTLTKSGKKPDYSNDAVYSVVDYLTKGYIADELNGKVIDMIQQAKKQAEESLIKNLEENLQQQLHADMVKSLNIPKLLQDLQNTIEHTEGE